ncbi:porin [Azospirillum sp.]|uniref:porin n=1 Tax=Azospirillum sp. TaxID=34012 RepID=UPI002626845B|nr:porin [Azospirillum sp.]
MTQVRLCGVAAIALAAIGGSTANAAQKFDIILGGEAYFEAGVVGQSLKSGQRSTEFRNRFQLKVSPTATADNGLEYGARFTLQAAANDRTITDDGAYMFVKGGFGQISAGVLGGPSDGTGVIAPSDWGTGGVDGSYAAFLGNTGSNVPSMTTNLKAFKTGDAGTRLLYASPRFSGFQAVVSHQPKTGNFHTSVDRSKTVETTDSFRTGGYSDVYEGGVNYADTLGDVTIAGDAFVIGGQARNTSAGTRFERLSSYHVGLSAAYGGLKVGGSYAYGGDSGYISRSSNARATDRGAQDVWTVGAQYTTGAYTLGLGYLRSKDAGDLTARGDRRFNLVTTGLRYTVAPGLALGAEYNHFDLKSDTTSQNDRGNIVLLRSTLVF